MKPQHQILIYHHDAAMRRAYAGYLNRNGLPTDSCGTVPELDRLLSWYDYDFILINVDALPQNQEPSSGMTTVLDAVFTKHQSDPVLIATSSQQEKTREEWIYDWFLQEPLTPKAILTTVSRIRQQQPKANSSGHIKLRKSLAKPMAFGNYSGKGD